MEKSLAAFRDGRDAITAAPMMTSRTRACGTAGPCALWRHADLIAGMEQHFPAATHTMLKGDGQRPSISGTSITAANILTAVPAARSTARPGSCLTIEAARIVAMPCPMTISSASRSQTRAARLARIDREFDGDILRITEYMHPRAEEISA